MGYDSENYMNKEIVSFYHGLSEEAPLNEAMRLHVETARGSTFPERKRILGVNVRTGGHARQSANHGKGHPIQPELEELVRNVKARKAEWEMELIFLACDTEYASEYFRAAFGDELIMFDRQRAEKGTEFGLDSDKILYAPGHLYQTSMDYLTEMELLSRCDALIGSVTSGFRYAVVRNGGRYERLEVMDCGRFSER